MSTASFTSNFFGTGCFWKDESRISMVKKQNEGKVFVKCAVNAKPRRQKRQFGLVFLELVVTLDLPDMVAIKDANFSDVDAVFCCLPHGTTQEIIKALPRSLKIVDLSADFRLRDISEYEEWYGQAHRAPDLQKEVVYGLTEVLREEIKSARLVANPGANLIEYRNIIIDAKSGVSGAGRGAKEANLYTEIAEGIYSYGITRHRHVPEIEQGLSDAANSKNNCQFYHT
ncbi:putative n-acetyl-gamma-glutamyl-phosphate reductase [Quercus suber]|uniref:N-acetyl-gamma-glutamyl-phosphate reductase n=1 Tax=Quercus suber TaxID=58331 RepID=A0AAW0LJV1_QUESU